MLDLKELNRKFPKDFELINADNRWAYIFAYEVDGRSFDAPEKAVLAFLEEIVDDLYSIEKYDAIANLAAFGAEITNPGTQDSMFQTVSTAFASFPKDAKLAVTRFFQTTLHALFAPPETQEAIVEIVKKAIRVSAFNFE